MPFDVVDAAAVGNGGDYGGPVGIDVAELASAASASPATEPTLSISKKPAYSQKSQKGLQILD